MLINNQEHSDLCVGIDLGTTNSALATINKKPNGDIVSKVVEVSRPIDVLSGVGSKSRMSSQKKPLLPSCVYYDEQHGFEPIVGDFAKMQYPNRPHLVAKSIKSQMGKAFTEGLDEVVPDKTPAEISARILKHMLKETGKVYRQQITDAVITVPANFDSVMCQATRDAAALAGIQIKNPDGSERPVLLSEPNAVIYDLINQVQNGEISSHIIDLSTEKNVVVFDLGGGTLDITMHKIKRREDCPDVLKVDEIATNRYTKLGGDDFDEAIANVMYSRYLGKYSKYADVKSKLEKQKASIMPVLRNYAEQLKLEISERYRDGEAAADDGFGWDDGFDDDNEFNVGGNIGGIGYAYDDSFTKEEVEEILSRFMGKELSFNDYQKLNSITQNTNIIYPILDVLQKAAEKLQSIPKVDAVIVNGGMSKFYMIIDRLREFFGLEPIVALDSDLAVARGAAVYHYYLHLYAASMQEDMRMLHNTDVTVAKKAERPQAVVKPQVAAPVYSADMGTAIINQVNKGIEFGHSTLNDALYLGVRNGAVQLLVPSGAELPYQSEIIRGFQLMPNMDEIAIPIKRRDLSNRYVTIASGRLKLKRSYKDGAYVSIGVNMDSSKVITMQMAISEDVGGSRILETQVAEIVVGDYEVANKNKITAPMGTKLDVNNELHSLKQKCDQLNRLGRNGNKSAISKAIATKVQCICSAGNKEDFAGPILDMMRSNANEELQLRLFIIARKHCESWSASEKAALAKICLNQLFSELSGFADYGFKRNVNFQAIYTLSYCGSNEQLWKLEAIKNNSAYTLYCMYAFGKRHLNTEWIFKQFNNDARFNSLVNLQTSAHALGMAMRRDEGLPVESINMNKAIDGLCGVLANNVNIDPHHSSSVVCSIIALGYACDQRYGDNPLDVSVMNKARHALTSLPQKYSDDVLASLMKSAMIALKMMDGETLSYDEEQFLLKKLSC